jgi:tetratricopeptide (TPR) repeat protein
MKFAIRTSRHSVAWTAPLGWSFALWLALGCAHAVAPAPTREQALADLVSGAADARRNAAARLAEVGQQKDIPALLKALRDRDEDTRAIAERAIWDVWSRSGNAGIDRLFARGLTQLNGGKTRAAIATFSQVIRKKPEFAEGWNKRATLYFLIGDYRRSLQDCHQVIRRNPYHFGALAGYGQIYVELDQPERALDYFRRALRLNPNMPGVSRSIEFLEQWMAGRRERSI